MATGFTIRKNQYYDSVFLMRVAKGISDTPGVQQCAVVMATDANKETLTELGVRSAEIDEAGPNDLVVAVMADDQASVTRLLAELDARLMASPAQAGQARYHTLDAAMSAHPAANLAVISVPGEHAAREARKALEAGRHVFLFSDNVPLEQEVALKQLAKERGRLLMGPDCGTSIINGVGIGFANAVRRGPVGVVGASGTGIQEFTSLVHRAGSGISHAIGTGSHDLSDAVGGITTLMGLDALEADPGTRVIAIISKPAGAATLARLLARLRSCKKPVIACLLGLDEELTGIGASFVQVADIDGAVRTALALSGTAIEAFIRLSDDLAVSERARWHSGQRYLRGLFAGGTFCYQSQQILRRAGIAAYSNAPLDKRYRLENPEQSIAHTIIDLGDDHFTQGKPHPMIDARERRKRLLVEAADPEVAVILLDFVLGQIASPDPVADMIGAIRQAQDEAARHGRHITFVASICGTDQDHQRLEQQEDWLKQAGVFVLPSNAQAAEFCARLLDERKEVRNA